MSDTAIISTIFIIFVFLGTLLPFINEAFGQDESTLNVAKVQFETGQNIKGQDTINFGTVVVSILSMFFWTFGSIPQILDLLLFVPLRLIFAVLLFKLARGVGG